jgi:hypothetical protein
VIGHGSVTLVKPTVETNEEPRGLISMTDLWTPTEVKPPHIPVLVIGPKCGELPYSNETLWDMGECFLWMHLGNITFLSDAVIIDNDSYVLISENCHPRYWSGIYEKPDSITYEYDMYESAICLGHQHTAVFGHWLLEILPAYAVIPKDVLNMSVVVVPELRPHVLDGLEMVGVLKCQIVAGLDRAIFARNFYTARFSFCGELTKFLVTNCRKMIVEKFGLWKGPPTKFELYNRRNTDRCIGNFVEVLNGVMAEWPQFPWEECPDLRRIEQSARFFEQVKFLFAIHGSVLANMMFMQDETAVASIEMEQWLFSFFLLSGLTRKYHVFACYREIPWKSLTPNILDVRRLLPLFKRGLEMLQLI